MIFNNSSDRIAAQQVKLLKEQEALDTYEKVINQVSDLLPGVTEALININEALLPYESEYKQFQAHILSLIGAIVPQVTTTKETDDIPSSKKKPLQTLLNRSDLGYHQSSVVGFEFFLGFEYRNAKGGINAATSWKKFLEEAFASLRCSIVTNWEGSKITQNLKYLVCCQGGDFDLMQEIARFNILITPEEALEAQERGNGSEDTVEVATPIEEDEDDLEPDHDQVDDTDGEDQDPEDQDKDENEKLATKLAQSLLEEAKVKLTERNLVLAEVDTDEPYSDIPF